MAIMIPVECDLTRRPESERIVFDVIKKNLSDEWYVFHSFDYVTRDPSRRRWDGEVDFLLYHPQKGILVLEVKGGVISYRDGQWFQNDKFMDPVEQAKRNKYAVKALLEKASPRKFAMKYAHSVCFPACGMHEVWPAEAQGIVLTQEGLPYIEEFASKVLEETPVSDYLCEPPSPEDIRRVLSPVFEYGVKLSERIGIEEKQFFLFTEQQCEILDMLEYHARFQIRGCAGSGKTIMAVKKAKRLAAQGAKVLLLCFNQLLAEHLQREVGDQPEIKAAAFFEFCIELLKIPEEQVGKYRKDPRLYSEVLPKLLKEYLYKTCFCYDAIVVDEGQDFTPQAWEVISMLVPEDGPFYIFYDPDQNIFTREVNLPDFGIPPLLLKKNCRNTKKIFEALAPYQSIAAEIPDSAPEGADVRVLHGESRKLLEQELERLVTIERIPPHEIVILGGHALEHTSIGDNFDAGRFHIVNRTATVGAMEISYFTYMKFKGCEAKVVILLDVDEADPRWNANGIYTAMSRAVHQLVILRK